MIFTNIKNYRELKSITRDQMAADLGISLSGYSKIERGEIDITVNRLHKIAELLGTDAIHLLTFNAETLLNGKSNGHTKNEINPELALRDKYINTLEAEIRRLKKLVGEE